MFEKSKLGLNEETKIERSLDEKPFYGNHKGEKEITFYDIKENDKLIGYIKRTEHTRTKRPHTTTVKIERYNLENNLMSNYIEE